MDNMKCLKNIKTGSIIRVDDKQAYQMAGSQWKYTSKTEWKGQERGTIITEEKSTKNEQNRSK
jgi:hypothetical protein